jgi:hypothetical protein
MMAGVGVGLDTGTRDNHDRVRTRSSTETGTEVGHCRSCGTLEGCAAARSGVGVQSVLCSDDRWRKRDTEILHQAPYQPTVLLDKLLLQQLLLLVLLLLVLVLVVFVEEKLVQTPSNTEQLMPPQLWKKQNPQRITICTVVNSTHKHHLTTAMTR